MVRGLVLNRCAKEQNIVSMYGYNLNIILWLSRAATGQGFRRWGQYLTGSCPSVNSSTSYLQSCLYSPHPFYSLSLVTILGPSFSLVINGWKYMFCVGSLCSERRCRQDLRNYFRLGYHITNVQGDKSHVMFPLQPMKTDGCPTEASLGPQIV